MSASSRTFNGPPLDVLAVGAHPDDVELSCGGTIAKLAQLGYRVGILDLTEGELGSRGDVSTRATEATAAAAVLGLSYRENLCLPDGNVAGRSGTSSSSQEHLERVVTILRRLRPELIFLPYGVDRHPDHSAASTLLTDAVFFAGLRRFQAGGAEPYHPRVVLSYMLRHTFHPSCIIDVSDVYSFKLDAIRSYRSQLGLDEAGAPVGAADEPVTLLSSPLTLHVVTARDAYFGAMIGVRFGEAFLAPGPLPVNDPLNHYRTNLLGPCLLFPGQR